MKKYTINRIERNDYLGVDVRYEIWENSTYLCQCKDLEIANRIRNALICADNNDGE